MAYYSPLVLRNGRLSQLASGDFVNGSPVPSVFGRTGDIAAVLGDYTGIARAGGSVVVQSDGSVAVVGSVLVGAAYPALTQQVIQYNGAAGANYGKGGLCLTDTQSGRSVVLQVAYPGNLYVTDLAGVARPFTFGTWTNPTDSSTFVSGFNTWTITGGAGVNHVGLNTSPFATTQVSVQCSDATITGLALRGAASQTANPLECQNSSGVVKFAVQADGNLRTANAAAATTLGSVVKKLPVYDAGGTLLGYLPLYDAIT